MVWNIFGRGDKTPPPEPKILDGLGEPIAPLTHLGAKPIQLEAGTRASDRPELTHTVNADDRGPSPAAIQQGGTAYQPTLKEVASMSPAICCPRCSSVVTGLTDAFPEFTPTQDMPVELNRHLYKVEGCGCAVTQEWAGAIQAEVTHRQAGGVPRVVVDMTDVQRQTLFRKLEKALHKLMDAYPDQLLRHSTVAKNIERLLAVMQYVSKPQTIVVQQKPKIDEKIVADQAKKILEATMKNVTTPTGQQGSIGGADDFGYGTKYPAPKLGGTAASMGQVMSGPQLEGVPSPALLGQATAILQQPTDWVGSIAGAFPNCLAVSDRDRLRNKILESIDRHIASGTLLCQEVHTFLYFITFGTKKPLTAPLYSPQPVQQTAVPSTAPITRSTDVLTPPPSSVPVEPGEFHDRFKRKKRNVRKLDDGTDK